MHEKEKIEILKKAVSGEKTAIGTANQDDVTATVKASFNPQSRALGIDVVLQAGPGVHIENHMSSIGYVISTGKGQTRVTSARSWGVGEGPTFRAGVDILVTETGVRRALWRVGTFVQTSDGYRLWTQAGEFDIEALANAALAEEM